MRQGGRAPSGSPGARVTSPFFRSKFRVPTVPDHFVPRERLIDLLDDLSEYPVTAIVAPAGAGKTALASDWVRRGRWPSAWLALDESDREPAQFWTALMSALDTLAPGVADRATGLVARADDLDDVGRAPAGRAAPRDRDPRRRRVRGAPVPRRRGRVDAHPALPGRTDRDAPDAGAA